MLDAHSVITQAVNGHTLELARHMEISSSRLHQKLGPDCVYPKTKRLIRDIHAVSPEGTSLIKADLDAMFEELLGNGSGDIDDAELHAELFDAMHAKLKDMPRAIRLKECREAVVALNKEIGSLEKQDIPIREFSHAAVAQYRRNGNRK